MPTNKLLYAIKISELISTGIKIINVKIGQTNDIHSTLRQYKRSNPEAEILDLWEPNFYSINPLKCEKGLHMLAEKYAYERRKENFIFLQEGYENFKQNVDLLLKNVSSKVNKNDKRKTSDNYANKKPKLVKFKNKEIQVKNWRDLLVKVSIEIFKEKNDFSPATKIKGRKRIYFSTDKSELFSPVKIDNTNYFCEGNLSANSIVTITKKLLKTFGYDLQQLQIICE